MGRKPKGNVVIRPIPSVQKAFAILEFLCSTTRGYTISEIARIFKIPVSTCSSVLYTLVSCDYLTRDATGVFSLTMKLLAQASKGLSQIELNHIAQPELEKLTLATGLASALFIKQASYVVCIAKVEGSSHIRTAAHVGNQMPMHATCTGKAMLAYMPDEEVERIVESAGLPQLTENTITSISLFKKELARVRSQGYAVDDQEYGIGVRGISAPVFDSKGRVVAAISASGATFQLDRKTATVISAVKAAALEVSRTLGYSESVVNNVYRQAIGGVQKLSLPSRQLEDGQKSGGQGRTSSGGDIPTSGFCRDKLDPAESGGGAVLQQERDGGAVDQGRQAGGELDPSFLPPFPRE